MSIIGDFEAPSVVQLGMPTLRPEDIEACATREVSCRTCAALCCKRGVAMDLTPSEADFMRESGTGLRQNGPARERRRKSRLPFSGYVDAQSYVLESDCGNLVTGSDGQQLCAAYDDPRRPWVCGALDEGSLSCRRIRMQGGTDTQEQMAAYLLVSDPSNC